MTGPEHYREAERLIGSGGPPLELEMLTLDVAVAQVHATIALAAATALIDEKPRGGSFDAWREWEKVAGEAAVTAAGGEDPR
jgi:hypothetical protein